MKKRCNKCKKWKPFSEFHKHSSAKDNLRADCKRCRSEYYKKYYQIYKTTNHLRMRFQQIKQRCNNSKNKDYKYYGDKGIKCLFKSANEFVNYVINKLQGDPHKLQVDRINNDGHYEKGNIRLTTQAENLRNRKG